MRVPAFSLPHSQQYPVLTEELQSCSGLMATGKRDMERIQRTTTGPVKGCRIKPSQESPWKCNFSIERRQRNLIKNLKARNLDHYYILPMKKDQRKLNYSMFI